MLSHFLLVLFLATDWQWIMGAALRRRFGFSEHTAAKIENDEDALVFSNLYVFHPLSDIDGLLPVTQSISLSTPQDRTKRNYNYVAVKLSTKGNVVYLSSQNQVYMVLIRKTKLVFPTGVNWKASEPLVTHDFHSKPVVVQEGDFLMIIISHDAHLELQYLDFRKAQAEKMLNFNNPIDNFIEGFLETIEHYGNLGFVVAQVVKRSEASSNYCILKANLESQFSLDCFNEEARLEWQARFTELDCRREKDAHLLSEDTVSSKMFSLSEGEGKEENKDDDEDDDEDENIFYSNYYSGSFAVSQNSIYSRGLEINTDFSKKQKQKQRRGKKCIIS